MSLNDMVAESLVKEFPMTESQVSIRTTDSLPRITSDYLKEFSNWDSVTVSFKAPFDSS